MREIIFRGKRKDDGEWIEGYYAIQSNYACFQSELKYTSFIIKDEFMDWGLGRLAEYEVIPETVGQYTGLTDKNGKKIFDGDIIKTHGNDSYVIRYGEYIPRNYCLARYCDKPTIGFYAYDGERCFQLSTNSRCYEVIGNIHDNPELMETQDLPLQAESKGKTELKGAENERDSISRETQR